MEGGRHSGLSGCTPAWGLFIWFWQPDRCGHPAHYLTCSRGRPLEWMECAALSLLLRSRVHLRWKMILLCSLASQDSGTPHPLSSPFIFYSQETSTFVSYWYNITLARGSSCYLGLWDILYCPGRAGLQGILAGGFQGSNLCKKRNFSFKARNGHFQSLHARSENLSWYTVVPPASLAVGRWQRLRNVRMALSLNYTVPLPLVWGSQV